MSDSANAAAPSTAADPQRCPACRKVHDGSAAAAMKKLAQTPARLQKLVKGLDAKGLATSYGAGKWNVRQLVCHLRDCELMFAARWRLMLSEERPTLQAFDQDHWATSTRYDRQDAARALATHEMLRANNLELVKLAGPAALERVGVHAEYGAITLGQMARHLLAHDENHLKHVELARAAWLATKAGARRASSRSARR
jgi:hypothetical protein